MFSEGRWQEVLTAVGANPTRDAELNYYSGVALAQLGRLNEARERLLAGVRLWPHDPRFPTELAGVDFKQKKYAHAARWLQRALRLNPHDAYPNEFLATIYFLEGNLEAAVKYWNRAGKPQVAEVKIDPDCESSLLCSIERLRSQLPKNCMLPILRPAKRASKVSISFRHIVS